MPVYKLENEMSYTEFLKWIEFFKRRPIGWREDQRTYLFLRTQGVKQKAEDLFPTLRMLAEDSKASLEPDRAVPKGMFLERLRKAKDGDKLDLF